MDINKNSKNTYVRDEDYEKIASRIEKEFARKMYAEKGLQCTGVRGGMMDDIQEMALGFQYFYKMNLSKARQLLTYTAKEYLIAINNRKEIRPYLHNYPFRIENIEIMIWVQEPSGHDVPFDKIAFMSAVDGVLSYSLPYESGSYTREDLLEETYEEALKIIKTEESSNQSKICTVNLLCFTGNIPYTSPKRNKKE